MAAISSNPFDARDVLDGIVRWVEIETPTGAPTQVNRLGELIAEGYADLPARVDGFDLIEIATGGGCDGNFTAPHTASLDGLNGEGAHTHCEQMYIFSIEPQARLRHRLFQTLR